MKARVIKENYYVVAENIFDGGEITSKDLKRFVTELEAEKYFCELKSNPENANRGLDIYRYVNGVFDSAYFNKLATNLTADSPELLSMGYKADGTGRAENSKGIYDSNGKQHIKVVKNFEKGDIYITSGLRADTDNDQEKAEEVRKAFEKYCMCDWGDTCKEDAKMNDNAVFYENDRIVAKYRLSFGEIFIITESDHSSTTLLYCNEY